MPLRRLVGSDAPQPRARAPGAARRHPHERRGQRARRGRRTEDSLFVIADSDTGGVEIDDVQSVAQTALATGRTARATEPTRLGRQALVAEPLVEDGACAASRCSPTRSPTCRRTCRWSGGRILFGGAFAFLIAVLGGYLVARALSLRVKRLERAARKVASRRLLRPHRARLRRRARPARRRVRRHAAPARSGSTTRASSSSPRPRTSCARRCSRSAASSSCWRTRSSTRRRGGSSSTTCARRSSA